MSARILVVEDDEGIRRIFDRGLRLAGHELTVAADLASARQRWAEASFDLVLLDLMLPDGNGIDLLEELRALGNPIPVVLLSAREEGELRDRAAAAGATAYLPKPFVYRELLECIARVAGEA